MPRQDTNSFEPAQRAWLQLSALVVAAACGTYLRIALAPLQEALRISLGFDDRQIGLLQGPATALPMLLGAIPIGLWVDRGSRVVLLRILLGVAIVGSWASAALTGFWTLFAARSIVGFASFAINPVIISLIADLFPPERRGRTMMTMGIAQFAGLALAFALGGMALQQDPGAEGWRSALRLMSLLAIPLALSPWLVREPRRHEVLGARPSLGAAAKALWSAKGKIGPIMLSVMLLEMAIGAVMIWAVPAIIRGYGVGADRAGWLMALALIMSGVAGPMLGGILADLGQRWGGPRRTMLLLAGLALLGASTSFFGLTGTSTQAAAALILNMTVVTAACVMGTVLLSIVAANDVRGVTIAAFTAGSILIGNGLAPALVTPIAGATGGSIGGALALLGVSACALAAIIVAAASRLSAANR